MNFSRDFVVGIFVLIGLLILTAITISLRHWDLLSNRTTYYAQFKQVSKLDVGAAVLVSGIQVGQVADMEYQGGELPVLITMRIKREVVFYPSATVRVIPAQVIGDTTVNITPGQPVKGASEPIKPGSRIPGVEAPELGEVVTKVSDQMMLTMQGVSAILNDPQNQANFRKVIDNTAMLTEKMNRTFELINHDFKPVIDDLKRIAASLNNVLVDAQAMPSRVTSEIEKTGGSLRATAADYSESARTLTREINATSQHLQSTIEQAQKTIEANQKPLNDTLKEMGAATRELREILERLQGGQGTLGKLLTDPRPFEHLQQILSDISEKITGRQESLFPQMAPPAAPGSQEPAHP
jgi:phospholipid/cholesterol/gamma-HCH transport system substrate-binding protein